MSLSPEEKRVYGQLFQAADTENVGVVTGEIAVKFLEKSRLSPQVLGEVSRSDQAVVEAMLIDVGGRYGRWQIQTIEAFLRRLASVLSSD